MAPLDEWGKKSSMWNILQATQLSCHPRGCVSIALHWRNFSYSLYSCQALGMLSALFTKPLLSVRTDLSKPGRKYHARKWKFWRTDNISCKNEKAYLIIRRIRTKNMMSKGLEIRKGFLWEIHENYLNRMSYRGVFRRLDNRQHTEKLSFERIPYIQTLGSNTSRIE